MGQIQMNIALFAADIVGEQIARALAEREAISCLVLDSQNRGGMNSKIVASSAINDSRIIFSDELCEVESLELLKGLELDLAILAWWPHIVRWQILELPSLGCLNLHPSYLPFNRGKDPNFWSLVEDTPFGVTIHYADAGVDTGDIVFRKRIRKTWEDTGQTLYTKAQQAIVDLFRENLDCILAGDLPRTPQDTAQATSHRRSQLEAASYIDLEKSYRTRDLLNLLRARTFRPHPGAWFVEGGKRYEVRIEIGKEGTGG